LQGRLTRADGFLESGRAMPMQRAAQGDYHPSMTLAYGNDPIDAGPTSWEAWPVLLELRSGHRAAFPGGTVTVGPVRGAAAAGGAPFYSGDYKGTFYYRLAHHEPVATLRLDRRGAYVDGPRSITIASTVDRVGLCLATLEVTNTELTLAGPREPAAGYYFTDRRTGARLRAKRLGNWSGMLGPLRVGLSPGRRIFTAADVQWQIEYPGLDGAAAGGSAAGGGGAARGTTGDAWSACADTI
jgi:hypothetical protein